MRLNLFAAAVLSLGLFACTPAFASPDDKTEPTTATVINHAIDKASDGLTQIAHALSTAAPQAWKLAVGGVYAKGLASLIVGGICFGLFLILAICCVCFVFAACRRFAQKSGSESGGIFAFMAVLSGLLSVGLLIAVCVNFLDSDSWARVISPDGYLAQAILSKALN